MAYGRCIPSREADVARIHKGLALAQRDATNDICPDQRRHALQEQTRNDVTLGYTTPGVNNVRNSQAGAGGTVPRCHGAFACLAILRIGHYGGAATSSGLGDADAPANPFLFDATWVSYLFEGPLPLARLEIAPPKMSLQTTTVSDAPWESTRNDPTARAEALPRPAATLPAFRHATITDFALLDLLIYACQMPA
ncbi:hypothetical protein CSOJ01_02918 [Colletotrichum sojae]|uniref:Uncharacterized protein n=1 Tax=Colletotrichum sojae TaxID=2175907 RepID=A0A8H6JPU9_9PEZI|nr:hypothetical protein CSOJ01_02918 [Colletotrichum sojae]